MKNRLVSGSTFYDRAGNFCLVRDNGTIEVTTVNNDPSLAVQSEKDSCDINKIVSKFKSTGVMTNVRTDQPLFGDFSDLVDIQTQRIRMQDAQEAFMTLPAQIRKRFSNDPVELINFLNDENNRPEAIKLGLIDEKKINNTPPQEGDKLPQGDEKKPE